jgi:hypothetical protein
MLRELLHSDLHDLLMGLGGHHSDLIQSFLFAWLMSMQFLQLLEILEILLRQQSQKIH